MSAGIAAALFVLSLAVTLAASDVLVRGLDRLGARFGLSEGLLGLLTALGADAPEISSALAAVHAGARDIGTGVVLGSNIFNLAALLGVGAILAGHVRVRREGLALDGGVALLSTVLVCGLLLGILSPLPAALLLALVFVPYLVALGTSPRRLARLPVPGAVARVLALAISEVVHETGEDPRVALAAGPPGVAWLVLPALVIIVAGSAGMVTFALRLAVVWRLPHALVGGVILAALTSLPNAYAASRLALQGRGAAVVSETLNSNTINVLAGVSLPALFLGGRGAGESNAVQLGWLVGMTVLTLALLARRRGLRRVGGLSLVALYTVFVVVQVAGLMP